jgi:hypothetical protein
VVRNHAGRTILTENLGRLGAEAIETCEGEAEGSQAEEAQDVGFRPTRQLSY